MNNETRDTFSGKFGVFMSVIAAAVGLGSIWRFPYLLGVNGGGAFLVIYIAFMLIIGLPVMISEFVIGRRGQGNVFRSYKALSPRSYWYLAGFMGILTCLIVLAFYSTISGWAFQYMMRSAMNIFSTPVEVDHRQYFETFTSGAVLPLVWMFTFMILTVIIVMFGVQKGIEKYSKILMPVLFFSLIALAIKGLSLPGSLEGLKFLFYPDFSKINTSTILSALGQAAFSMGIGGGMMITFGSYIKKDENLPRMAFSVTLVDIIIAVIAAIAIFPAVFAFGMHPEEGPGLVYIVYPAIFEQMHGGNIFALSFFFMLIIAAITSAVPTLEVLVAFLREEFKMKRSTATLLSAVFPAFLGIFTTLSFGRLNSVKIFGLTIFECSNFFTSNILLPFGLFSVVIFLGWFYNKDHVKDEINNQGKLSSRLFPVFLFLLRYIAPACVLFVFLKGVGVEGFGLLESLLG